MREGLAWLGILCAVPVVSASSEILLPGEYHGDEVTAVSGQHWLGLFLLEGGGTMVAPVVLQVDKVLDALLDENGLATGKRVGFSGDQDAAVLLMKDVPHVEPGPVRTIAADVPIVPNVPVPLPLDATHPMVVELACHASPSPSHGAQQSSCELVLRAGEREQVLRTYDAYYDNGSLTSVGNDAPVRILWAGDLDRDGRLDLLVDLTEHYNVSLPTLFLSSAGQDGGALAVAVAQHRSVGC